jgi:hypothetical protein
VKSDPAAAAGSASVAITTSGASRAAVREDEGFWVAVLPFKYAGASSELKALADGLSEEVVTGLSRFSYLRVIARPVSPELLNWANSTCSEYVPFPIWMLILDPGPNSPALSASVFWICASWSLLAVPFTTMFSWPLCAPKS